MVSTNRVAGWWGEGLFNGHRVSVLEDEKSSEEWLPNDVNFLNPAEPYI